MNRPVVGSKRCEKSSKSGAKFRKKDVEELFPPRYNLGDKDASSEQDSTLHSSKNEKFKSHRSCNASPDRTDFCQIVNLTESRNAKAYADKYQQILLDQYGFDPIDKLPKHRVIYLQDVIKLLTSDSIKDVCGYEEPECTHIKTSDGVQWQTVDSPEDVDKYLSPDLSCLRDYQLTPSSPIGIPLRPTEPETKKRRRKSPCKETPKRTMSPSSEKLQRKRSPMKRKSVDSITRDRIRISETPRVKVIAEKYSKFRKKDIEIRKLEEKVVCVEYDVFDIWDMKNPRQKLRSFFSIKPVTETQEAGDDRHPDKDIKYQMDEYDLKRLTNKEIEIIDEKLMDNESYLKDLRRILKRKKTKCPDDVNEPELMGLYDLAKHEQTCQNHVSNTQVLTGQTLEEIKNFIVNRTESSEINSIDRRKLKPNININNSFKHLKGSSIISQSFFNELLRESGKAY